MIILQTTLKQTLEPLSIFNGDRVMNVEFLVDTGFNGFVAVPMDLVNELGLSLGAVQSGVTADGRSSFFDTVSLTGEWNGEVKQARAQVFDEPLMGTRLLNQNTIAANWIVGGEFQVTPNSEQTSPTS